MINVQNEKMIHAMQFNLPSTEQLLVEGGDARIALDPNSRVNKYGCQATPNPELMAYGSSTASVISEAGFAAADRLRNALLQDIGEKSPEKIYAQELNRIRRELIQLCGLEHHTGLEVIFAASGTDLHLIASQMISGTEDKPTLAIMPDPTETGSGVPTALIGCHFSNRSALGTSVTEGVPIAGNRGIEIVTVAIRSEDGTPRDIATIDAEVESLVTNAAKVGQRVLLILVDVSKTGFIAPSPACVLALHQRYPDTVDVLVDACQFRISPSTLQAYLENDFMVAVTGSKFLTGPTFSGALMIPANVAQRLNEHPLPSALCAYSTRADWPQSWSTAKILDNVANFGLLLRWEAALEEFRTFRALSESDISNFLQLFKTSVENHLKNHPTIECVSIPSLNRGPLTQAASWDSIQTIFPCVLYHPGGVPLNREETAQIYRWLQTDISLNTDLESFGLTPEIARMRCQLGQPVACGSRNTIPVSALRLCSSARLVVKALKGGPIASETIIKNALATLDKAAALVQKLGVSPSMR